MGSSISDCRWCCRGYLDGGARTLSGKRGMIVLLVVSLETVSYGGLWAVGVHVFATVSFAALLAPLGPPFVLSAQAASDCV